MALCGRNRCCRSCLAGQTPGRIFLRSGCGGMNAVRHDSVGHAARLFSSITGMPHSCRNPSRPSFASCSGRGRHERVRHGLFPDVVEYICFQLRHAGDISFRKMFGDYGLYCGRTFFGLVCDNQLYVKITEPGLKMFPQQEQGCPYPGARPHFLVTELDDDRILSSLVRETCSVLAVPSVLEGKKKKASGEKRSRRP